MRQVPWVTALLNHYNGRYSWSWVFTSSDGGEKAWGNWTRTRTWSKTDENGIEYVVPAYNEAEKTKQGNEKDHKEKEAVMYAQGGSRCPVNSYKLYLSKLNPQCDALFQYPKPNYSSDGVWYNNKPVGKNSIAEMMKKISVAAGLSKVYTNHCIRATSITVLHRAGLDGNAMTAISGHKSVDSLKSYIIGPSQQQKKSVSSILHNFAEPTSAIGLTPQGNPYIPYPNQYHATMDDQNDTHQFANQQGAANNPTPTSFQQHPYTYETNATYGSPNVSNMHISYGPSDTTYQRPNPLTLQRPPNQHNPSYPVDHMAQQSHQSYSYNPNQMLQYPMEPSYNHNSSPYPVPPTYNNTRVLQAHNQNAMPSSATFAGATINGNVSLNMCSCTQNHAH